MDSLAVSTSISNKHRLLLSNADLSPDYYLSGKTVKNNHDILFLTGLMTVSALVILTFIAIRFGITYFSNLNLSPQTQNNHSVTYTDIYV